MILPIECGLTFARPTDAAYATSKLSDHNRSPISVSISQIESKQRMANGTLRKFAIATKKSLKISWTNLPRQDQVTVDKHWGANSMKNFFETHQGAFYVTINYGDGTNETLQVMFSDFNYKLSSRGRYTDFYDVDFGLEEV